MYKGLSNIHANRLRNVIWHVILES